MPAERAIRPWHGHVYRHIPGDSPFGPLDTRFARRPRENHWNRPGEPSLYFVTERTMLADLFAHHLARERAPELSEDVQTRRIFEIDIELERVYDLTNLASVAELGIVNAPACFREPAVARATAGFLRDVIGVEAILAPSIAHLHQAGHRILILFLDRLEHPLSDIARSVSPSGSFQPAASPISAKR